MHAQQLLKQGAAVLRPPSAFFFLSTPVPVVSLCVAALLSILSENNPLLLGAVWLSMALGAQKTAAATENPK